MTKYVLPALFLLAVVVLVASAADNLTVVVEQGALLGTLKTLATGNGQFYSFKGIPYAATPNGTLRFKAPQAPIAWTGVRNASTHGNVCPQFTALVNGSLVGSSEDCLFLNVYTTKLNVTTLRPVMVFIHGGGYLMGSGNDNIYGPDFLIPHGVVLVTLNYRLDALGFLSMDTEDVPGNAGLKDQVLALKWVQTNIAKFGGNPKNVTVFGQSVGGAAALAHTISPLSKGLLNRAIGMSGVPISDWALGYESQERAFVFGRYLGIYTNDTSELLTKLQAVSVDKLINIRAAVLKTEETPLLFKMLYFNPVIETDFGGEQFLIEDIETTLSEGNISDVDIMLGHTNNEGNTGVALFLQTLDEYDKFPETLVPREIINKCSRSTVLNISSTIRAQYFGEKKISNNTMKEFVSYINPCSFLYDIRRFSRQIPTVTNQTRYFYQFSASSERNAYSSQASAYGLTGAGHSDDILYLFNAPDFNLTLNTNATSYTIINKTCTLFTNFAKYGNPTPDTTLGVTWKQYDADEDKNFLNISSTLTALETLSDDYDFWAGIYADASSCSG